MAVSAGVHVMANQHRIVRVMHQAGAVSPDSARSPEDLGLRDSLVLAGLVRRGVVVRTADGRVHLDPARAEHWRHTRRRRLLVLVLLVLATLILWNTLEF